MAKIKPIRLAPGNIWSGSPTLAVFTNPTELAFRKGNLKNHYPIKLPDGRRFLDAETAYQQLSSGYKADTEYLYQTMQLILEIKFDMYPVLVQTIELSGGQDWIWECSHIVNKLQSRWEGYGRDSGFLRCLSNAFKSRSQAHRGCRPSHLHI